MRTRYVKSAEEVRRLQEVYAHPSFLQARSLAVAFRTDPEVVRELLPPPLQPAAAPRATVSVYDIGRSNCVGAFSGASLNVACSFEGQEGWYCVTMPMSTDTAVIFGRELYAEPKKLAECLLTERGQVVRGTVTRHGITFIEISGLFDAPLADVGRPTLAHHYYFKHFPAADGRGLAGDVELVQVTHRGTVHRMGRGNGTVVFRESPHDPVIDIPVLEIEGTTLSEAETHTSAAVVARIPAAQFLPWAYGKTDDLMVWADVRELAPA